MESAANPECVAALRPGNGPESFGCWRHPGIPEWLASVSPRYGRKRMKECAEKRRKILFQNTKNLNQRKRLPYSRCVKFMCKKDCEFRLAIGEWMVANDCRECMTLMSRIFCQVDNRVKANFKYLQALDDKEFLTRVSHPQSWLSLSQDTGSFLFMVAAIRRELDMVLRSDSSIWHDPIPGSCADDQGEDPQQSCFHSNGGTYDLHNAWYGSSELPGACRLRRMEDMLTDLWTKHPLLDRDEVIWKYTCHLCQMRRSDFDPGAMNGIPCRVFALFFAPVMVRYGFTVNILLGKLMNPSVDVNDTGLHLQHHEVGKECDPIVVEVALPGAENPPEAGEDAPENDFDGPDGAMGYMGDMGEPPSGGAVPGGRTVCYVDQSGVYDVPPSVDMDGTLKFCWRLDSTDGPSGVQYEDAECRTVVHSVYDSVSDAAPAGDSVTAAEVATQHTGTTVPQEGGAMCAPYP